MSHRFAVVLCLIALCPLACSPSSTGPAANDNTNTNDNDPGDTVTLCTDTCVWAMDGECDDGGPGSAYSLCDLGTDCTDCGPREVESDDPDVPDTPDDGFGQQTVTTETAGPYTVISGTATNIALADGTSLTLPALTTTDGSPLTQLTLTRSQNDVDLSDFDQEDASAMRVLSFSSFDPNALGLAAAQVVPSLTIPLDDASTVDADTLTVARVSDLYLEDEETITQQVHFLPVNRDDDGHIVVTDYLFADSIIADLVQQEALGAASVSSAQPAVNPREIRYVVGTFRGSINWAQAPVLLRMVPDPEHADGRVPASTLSTEERADLDAKGVRNVVVLIHGHNEQERTGADARLRQINTPWYYAYKRDVWTNLYDYLSDAQPELLECTAFYEFIYPTYKPIFTPTGTHQRLDEALAEELHDEILPHLQAGTDVKLFFVAHSMGGLVARAGIQRMDAELQAAFTQLVTWGSPHRGSPLVTLRYVLGAPPDTYRAGPDGVVTFPLSNLDNTLFALRRAIDNMQVDAPGTRDLRWALSHTTTEYNLALDSLFTLGEGVSGDSALTQHYSLANGPWLYNENLRNLNEMDLYRLSDKLTAFYGITTKRPVVTSTWYFKPKIVGTETAKGAFVMPWLVAEPTATYHAHQRGSSDGAVPIVSMAAAGTTAYYRDLGDVDHEEYFGAPDQPGHFTEHDTAWEVADATISTLGLTECPPPGQQVFTIAGTHDLADDDLSSCTTDPLNDDDSGYFVCASCPDEISITYNATISVPNDGTAIPTIQQSADYPNQYDVYLAGYTGPITVTGQYSYELSPTTSVFQDDYYTPGYYYEYSLAARQFGYYATAAGNSSSDYAVVDSGGTFTWTYTHDGEWQPSFGIEALIPSHTRTQVDAYTDEPEPDSTPITTACKLYGIPAGFVVRFHIN